MTEAKQDQARIDDLTQALINVLRDRGHNVVAWPKVDGYDISLFFEVQVDSEGAILAEFLYGNEEVGFLIEGDQEASLKLIANQIKELIEFCSEWDCVDGVPKVELLSMYQDQLTAVENAVEVVEMYKRSAHLDGTNGGVNNEYHDRLSKLHAVRNELQNIVRFLQRNP